jgi:hypothetical protein
MQPIIALIVFVFEWVILCTGRPHDGGKLNRRLLDKQFALNIARIGERRKDSSARQGGRECRV